MRTAEQLQVALEAIDFQGDKLFKKLVKILSAFPREERAGAGRAQWEKLEKALEKALNDSTHLKLYISIGRYGNFMVANPVFDMNHILHAAKGDVSKNPDEYIKYLTKTEKEIRNSIDLKKSTVSGHIAEMEIPVCMSIECFYQSVNGVMFTDPELMAILLHELGHLFTMIEMMDRVVLTNQVMAEMQRNLLGGDVSKRETIIKAAIDNLSLDRNLLSQVQGKNDEITTTVLLTNGIKCLRSQSGDSFYDRNTWEMLSDQFAVRHGAGSDLASAIRKFGIANKDLTELDTSEAFRRQVMAVGGSFTLLTLAALGFAAGSFIAATIAVVFGLLAIRSDHMLGDEPTYDNVYSRFRRIRLQINQQIKMIATGEQNNFSAAYKKQLQDELEKLDALMSGMEDRKSLIQRLQIFFSSNEANRHANVQFQKELEGLANNDLYAKALAMKTL